MHHLPIWKQREQGICVIWTYPTANTMRLASETEKKTKDFYRVVTVIRLWSPYIPGIKSTFSHFDHKIEVNGKGKICPRTGHEGREGEYMYSFTLSLTWALDEVGGQRHDLAALPPGKTRYPLYRRLGEPQNRSGRVGKIQPHRDSIPRPSSL